jgi:hypothetical protein
MPIHSCSPSPNLVERALFSAIEDLSARSLEHGEPLADLPGGDPKVDKYPFEQAEEVVERLFVHASLPRPDVSVMQAPSGIGVGAAHCHGKESFLNLLESFNVHAEEEGAERRIRQHSGVERVEGGTNRRGAADVLIESHVLKGTMRLPERPCPSVVIICSSGRPKLTPLPGDRRMLQAD